MRVQVQKWGNSLAVRIPRPFAAEAGMAEGTAVEMSLEKGDIRLRAVRRPEYTLEGLLDQITPENSHGELESGPSRGQEAW